MPTYDVIGKGFYNGQSYSPDGKRRELTVPKALKPAPAWLKPRKASKKKAEPEAPPVTFDETPSDETTVETL